MKYLLILTLFLSITSVFASRNGTSVDRFERPYMVKIKVGRSTCSGVRISYNYVLTVAHCFTSSKKRKFTAYYIDGVNGNTLVYESIRTRKVIYNGHSSGEELAVFPISAISVVTPKLPRLYHNFIRYGNEYDFFGFGYNTNGSIGELLKAKQKYTYTHMHDGHKMTVTTPTSSNQQPCPGDSGGGLFDGEDLLGIISFVNSSSQSIEGLTPVQQCSKANRSYFIGLSEHKSFVQKFL